MDDNLDSQLHATSLQLWAMAPTGAMCQGLSVSSVRDTCSSCPGDTLTLRRANGETIVLVISPAADSSCWVDLRTSTLRQLRACSSECICLCMCAHTISIASTASSSQAALTFWLSNWRRTVCCTLSRRISRSCGCRPCKAWESSIFSLIARIAVPADLLLCCPGLQWWTEKSRSMYGHRSTISPCALARWILVIVMM